MDLRKSAEENVICKKKLTKNTKNTHN